MNYERHFLSACWPDITGEEYEHLKDSIFTSGLREPITLYEGQILDGWNRFRACTDMAMTMTFVEFSGNGEEAEQFVNDKHNRRSMSLTQRMACVAKMATWPGRGSNQHTKAASAPGAHPQDKSAPGALYRKELAKKTGGSVRTAQQVINVVKSGNEDAINAMVRGKMSAKAAEAKVKGKEEKPLPKKSQVADFKAKQEERRQQEANDSLEVINGALQEEIYKLRETLALDDLPLEERIDAKDLIDRLREENAALKQELATVKAQRDEYMAANADMQRHIKKLNRA